MKNNDHEKLAELIKDIQFAMLTTLNAEGRLHSRPMATLEIKNARDFDGTLWFFTRIDSLKVHDIEQDKEVNLAYANPDSQRYISLTGIASVEKNLNKMKELWTPMLKSWFPKELNDPEIALIKVEVESAEIWNTPPSKVVKAIGKAKSILTDKPYDQHANSQHIELRPQH